jgi:hypothetical protein
MIELSDDDRATIERLMREMSALPADPAGIEDWRRGLSAREQALLIVWGSVDAGLAGATARIPGVIKQMSDAI